MSHPLLSAQYCIAFVLSVTYKLWIWLILFSCYQSIVVNSVPLWKYPAIVGKHWYWCHSFSISWHHCSRWRCGLSSLQHPNGQLHVISLGSIITCSSLQLLFLASSSLPTFCQSSCTYLLIFTCFEDHGIPLKYCSNASQYPQDSHPLLYQTSFGHTVVLVVALCCVL